MLYYWAVITSGGDHGHILYTLYMIHVVTKVGPARGAPASDSRELEAERTFVPTALWVDLCGGATGQVETA